MAPPLSALLTFLHSQIFITVPKPTASFKGCTVIVTGGNIGLGLETARTIASLGAAKVIISSRSMSKGEEARTDILTTTKCDPSTIEVWPLDLCSFDSVRTFATRAKALPRLDVLICNAGVSTRKFWLAEDHESTITTNVIGTFLLSFLVLPKLKEAAAKTNDLTRLVIVASEVHFFTAFAERKNAQDGIFKALSDKEKADMTERYFVSKLLEVFVVRQITSDPALCGPKGNDHPYPVVISAPNPGFCISGLARELHEGSVVTHLNTRMTEILLARSSEEGARNFIICASARENFHGQYVSNGIPRKPAPLVLSEEGKELQKQVWEELRDILEGIEPGVTKNF